MFIYFYLNNAFLNTLYLYLFIPLQYPFILSYLIVLSFILSLLLIHK